MAYGKKSSSGGKRSTGGRRPTATRARKPVRSTRARSGSRAAPRQQTVKIVLEHVQAPASEPFAIKTLQTGPRKGQF